MPAQTIETRDMEVSIKANLGVSDRVARRMVNLELIKKVGDLIMTDNPELLMDGEKLYWKVPFLVVPPDGDPNTYPTGQYALVDALSGLYVLEEETIEDLKKASEPILDQLYPELNEYMQRVRECKADDDSSEALPPRGE